MVSSMSSRVTWDHLRRFRALSRGEQWLFVRAMLLLPLLSASLRVAGFGRTQRALQRFLPALASKDLPSAELGLRVAATARILHSAVQHGIARHTCLERSLALWWLLGRQGIAAELRMGARKTEEHFEAHAWVEHSGAVLNDPGELHQHYAAFDASFPTCPTSTPEAR